MRAFTRFPIVAALLFVLLVPVAGVTAAPAVSQVAVLSVSPTYFSFVIGPATPWPAPVPVDIADTGDAGLSWSAVDSAPSWLTFAPSQGQVGAGGVQTATLHVLPQQLTQGVFTGTITINAVNAQGNVVQGSPAVVTVVVRVVGLPRSTLIVSPPELDFFVSPSGVISQTQPLMIADAGFPGFSWTSRTSATWLTVAPPAGLLGPNQRTSVAVTVQPPFAIASGLITGTITITAPGAQNSPATVLVLVHIGTAAPVLVVHPLALYFSITPGWPVTNTLPLYIANAGGSPLTWAGIPGATWLHMTPITGTLAPGQTTSAIVRVMIPAGAGATLSTTLTIAAPGASGSPVTVLVYVRIGPPPPGRLKVWPLRLVYNVNGRTTRQTRTIEIVDLGPGPLRWRAVVASPWILVTPSSGVLGLRQRIIAKVTISPGGLPIGTTISSVLILTAQPQGSPATVRVIVHKR